jgi:hypothetical protein
VQVVDREGEEFWTLSGSFGGSGFAGVAKLEVLHEGEALGDASQHIIGPNYIDIIQIRSKFGDQGVELRLVA